MSDTQYFAREFRLFRERNDQLITENTQFKLMLGLFDFRGEFPAVLLPVCWQRKHEYHEIIKKSFQCLFLTFITGFNIYSLYWICTGEWKQYLKVWEGNKNWTRTLMSCDYDLATFRHFPLRSFRWFCWQGFWVMLIMNNPCSTECVSFMFFVGS